MNNEHKNNVRNNNSNRLIWLGDHRHIIPCPWPWTAKESLATMWLAAFRSHINHGWLQASQETGTRINWSGHRSSKQVIRCSTSLQK